MKALIFLTTLVFFCTSQIHAQQDSTLKHLDLDEFVLSAGKPKSKRFKARIDNVTQIVPSANTNSDTFSYLTFIPAISEKPISIYEVLCRVEQYDTSEMSMFLLFVQIQNKDTIIKRISLDNDIIKHNRTVHHLAGEELIRVKPGGFYLGYGILSKAKETRQLQLYCSSVRQAEGALMVLSKAGVGFIAHNKFLIFPFQIKYY